MSEGFSGNEADPGIRRARSKGYSGPLGWRLARPVIFGDSKEHPALQIADIVAGAAAHAIRQEIPNTSEVEAIGKSLRQHCLPQCILPDLRIIDPKTKAAAVNAAILYRLAQKAGDGRDLYAGLERDYIFVEERWDAGEFRLG